MSPIDRDILRRKLQRIIDNLRTLDPIAELDLASYRADIFRRKGTERLLQEIVEAATDINAHILVESDAPPPTDLHQSFVAAGALGALSVELAVALAPSAGLRNRIVHEYDAIDDGIVLAAVRQAQDLYARYVAEIEAFLRGP